MHLVQSLLNCPLSAGMLTDLLDSLFTTVQTSLNTTCHTYYSRLSAGLLLQTVRKQQRRHVFTRHAIHTMAGAGLLLQTVRQ